MTIWVRISNEARSVRDIIRAGLLIFALCIAPIAGPADASQNGSPVHAAAGHQHGPEHSHHGKHGPELLHCGSYVCAPSFLVGLPSSACLPAGPARSHQPAADDPLLPSLYLDSDPPVPRGAFSLT